MMMMICNTRMHDHVNSAPEPHFEVFLVTALRPSWDHRIWQSMATQY